MSQVNSIRIQNLRSLTDTNFIKLQPLTILVGKNSVGKSTFARTFPLLRQSCEAQKKSPILWYGKYVDFGDYETSINKNNYNDGILLSFNLSINLFEILDIFDFGYTIRTNLNFELHKLLSNIEKDVEVKLLFIKNDDDSYSYKIDLSFFNHIIKIDLNKDEINVLINNINYNINNDKIFTTTQNRILPNFTINPEKKRNTIDRKLTYFNYKNFMYLKLIKDFIKLDKMQDIDNEEYYSELLTKSTYDFLYKAERKIKKKIPYPIFNIDIKDQADYENIFIISKLPEILNYIDTSISKYFRKVQYLEPLRATAQRYYRKQELAINEVDSKGSNIAMFLVEHHTNSALKRLIQEHFDLEFITDSNKGHITLNLLLDKIKNEKINLADLGVGYSQILPVILQLWSAVYNNKNDEQGCLVVEQPELHLHPAYQAKIADITIDIINQIKKSGRIYNFIYETHSPHLINRIGELIDEGKFDKNDVQILIFDNESHNTQITEATFDDNGSLINWPFGFFL